jgi:hypothetical protein
VLVEARGAGKDTELRQLYLVRGAGGARRQGIVVTLSTRAATLATASPAFDWAVVHLLLEVPLDADEAAAKPAARPSAADAGTAPTRR